MPPPQRRIEDRIRELCAKTTTNTGDLEPALQELSQLLRETIEHMRLSATNLLDNFSPAPGLKSDISFFLAPSFWLPEVACGKQRTLGGTLRTSFDGARP